MTDLPRGSRTSVAADTLSEDTSKSDTGPHLAPPAHFNTLAIDPVVHGTMNPDLAFTHASVGLKLGFHARKNGFTHLVRVCSTSTRRFANAILMTAAKLWCAKNTPSKAPAVQDLQQATRVGHESRRFPYRIACLAPVRTDTGRREHVGLQFVAAPTEHKVLSKMSPPAGARVESKPRGPYAVDISKHKDQTQNAATTHNPAVQTKTINTKHTQTNNN